MSGKLFLLLVALFGTLANAYISNIVIDKHNGQIYVTENNVLYELDNADVEQNAVHYTPGSPDLLFVGKHGNKKVLFSYLDETTELAYFPLPLRNQRTLRIQDSADFPPGLSKASTFDITAQRGILSVSRNLTLVNLNNLDLLDTLHYYQNRVFGVNLIYNHQNERLTLFYTKVPINAPYGLSVDEWDLSDDTFVELETTYNCLCREEDGYNATESPFFHVEFPGGSCDIDYSSNPARIWCPYPEAHQLFSFNSADLSDFEIITTAADFDSVAWDFANKLAYAIDAVDNDLVLPGFSVSKVRLNNGNVVNTYSNIQYAIDPTVFALDSNEHHLYIAVSSDVESDPARIISVGTGLQNAHVATLNTDDLN
jgi:hypothetical protein